MEGTVNQLSLKQTTSFDLRSSLDVIERLNEYNQSQANKILRIDNDSSGHDVGGTSHESNVSRLLEPAEKTVAYY